MDRSNSSLPSSNEFTNPFLVVMMTSASCCVFFIINGTILYILRSKPMFSQCPRYVLLFNLVLADTLLIVHSQIYYLIVKFRVQVSYPLCGSFAMMSRLTYQISPLTLVFMSLDCFIAVCFPFKHCTLVTLRNTVFAILLIWTIAFFHIMVLVSLLVDHAVTFERLPDWQKRLYCSIIIMPLVSNFMIYELMYTIILFVLSAGIILGLLIAVMVIACLAAGDKAQMEKMRYTLLVHLFQIGLTMVSMMSVQIYTVAMRCCKVKPPIDVIYVFILLAPRCLSPLSNSLRDPALRPALRSHLCCTQRLSAGRVKTPVLKKGHKSSPNGYKRWKQFIQ